MNIVGIGVDTIEIKRVKRIMSGKYGQHFLDANFTESEISYINSKPKPIFHIATTFAAKEAVFKALGTGWTKGKNVKIIRNAEGKPFALVEKLNGDILLSLSYNNNFAVAFATIIRK